MSIQGPGPSCLGEQVIPFVMGSLEKDELEVYRLHLESGCPKCEQEVAHWQELTNRMSLTAPAEAPSPSVRERLLQKIRQEDGSKHEPKGEPASDPAKGATPCSLDPESVQVWKRWPSSKVGDGSQAIIRKDDSEFTETSVPGVFVRKLHVDPEHETVTMLVRMQAGASYPRHAHADAEECLVLEGDLKVGDVSMTAGDFQYQAPGSHHSVQSTEKGCLLYIRCSLNDELLV